MPKKTTSITTVDAAKKKIGRPKKAVTPSAAPVSSLSTELSQQICNAIAPTLEQYDKRISSTEEALRKYEKVLSLAQKTIVAQEEAIRHCDEILARHSDQLDVVGLGTNGAYYKKIKGAYTARVHELLGEAGNPYYVLWAPFFYPGIQRSICLALMTDTVKNVRVSQTDTACAIAETWVPSQAYLETRLNVLRSQRDMGLLKDGRAAALYIYMNETEDGTINPFLRR